MHRFAAMALTSQIFFGCAGMEDDERKPRAGNEWAGFYNGTAVDPGDYGSDRTLNTESNITNPGDSAGPLCRI